MWPFPGKQKNLSDPPLCCVKFMLTLPFLAGKKFMTLPWIPPAYPPFYKMNAPLEVSLQLFNEDHTTSV